MFYGDSKTKIYLWFVFALTTIAAALLIAGLATVSGGMIGGAVTIGLFVLLLSQSVSLSDTGFNPDETVEEREQRKAEERNTKLQKKENAKKEKIIEQKTEDAKIDEIEADAKEQEQNTKTVSYESYDEKSIKKYFHKYKVKRDHRCVIIDSSSEFKIRQCPAYIWAYRGTVHLLLLEKEPRKIQFSQGETKHISYMKNVLAFPQQDYKELQKASLISTVFSNYIPSYREVNYQGKRSFRKNLYVFDNGIRFTNTSAKDIFEILDMEFLVDDEVTKSTKFNDEFKNLYKNRILLNDHVIDINEYQERMKLQLNHFSATKVSKTIFAEGLSLMVKYQLITQEYRMFYLEHREDFAK